MFGIWIQDGVKKAIIDIFFQKYRYFLLMLAYKTHTTVWSCILWLLLKMKDDVLYILTLIAFDFLESVFFLPI